MAYYKPNLYSLKKQEMLNNIAANSNQCNPNSSGENNCGVGNMSLGVPIPGMPGCGYTGMSGCSVNSVNDGPVCGATSLTSGCGSNGSGNNPPACGNHHQPPTPSCTTWTNSAQFGGFGIGINDNTVSIDLDPYTNEIKITAGSAYPIELLAELCRELYT